MKRPEGALSSVEEVEGLLEQALSNPVVIWCVWGFDVNIMRCVLDNKCSLQKVPDFVIHNAELEPVGRRGDIYFFGLNLAGGKMEFATGGMFTNYFHAYAHKIQREKREKKAEKVC